MSHHVPSRGRPRSSQRSEFSSWVRDRGRFTLADVADRFAVGIGPANNLVQRALRQREIHVTPVTDRTRAKRPVAVYGAGDQATVPLADALRCWVR